MTNMFYLFAGDTFRTILSAIHNSVMGTYSVTSVSHRVNHTLFFLYTRNRRPPCPLSPLLSHSSFLLCNWSHNCLYLPIPIDRLHVAFCREETRFSQQAVVAIWRAGILLLTSITIYCLSRHSDDDVIFCIEVIVMSWLIFQRAISIDGQFRSGFRSTAEGKIEFLNKLRITKSEWFILDCNQ